MEQLDIIGTLWRRPEPVDLKLDLCGIWGSGVDNFWLVGNNVIVKMDRQ
jgi:hypothetical protein